MPGELNGQVTGETPGILDQHDADAVLLAMVEQLDEAGARVDRIGAADGGIVELGDDLDPGGLGVGGSAYVRLCVDSRVDGRVCKSFRQRPGERIWPP